MMSSSLCWGLATFPFIFTWWRKIMSLLFGWVHLVMNAGFLCRACIESSSRLAECGSVSCFLPMVRLQITLTRKMLSAVSPTFQWLRKQKLILVSVNPNLITKGDIKHEASAKPLTVYRWLPFGLFTSISLLSLTSVSFSILGNTTDFAILELNVFFISIKKLTLT